MYHHLKRKMAASDNDLPLTANTDEALVRHWVLDLDCCLERKALQGSICLFLDVSDAGENKQVFSIQEFQTQAAALEGQYSDTGDSEKGILTEEGKTDISDSENSESKRTPFHLVLECCDINIQTVHILQNPEVNSKHKLSQLFQLNLTQNSSEFQIISQWPETKELQFKTTKWSLDIWCPDIESSRDFPRVIKIQYETKPEGSSLRWATDQDGHRCVYTAGMWVNNRSLFPCQEYGSLATWQASVTVRQPAVVLISADDCELRTDLEEGEQKKYSYQSSMPLPSFAFALAIGTWDQATIYPKPSPPASVETTSESKTFNPPASVNTLAFMQETCFHQNKCHIPYNHLPALPCRIFAPASVLPRAVEEFSEIFPVYCEAVQEILGPLPFPRLDIMVYPACSQDMAMCNPSLLFLSQSVLAGDKSMASRLGHELSHYWFGLLLGARDWTEEWLSEGFATYVEELVHCRVHRWSDTQEKEYGELCAYLRYKTLAAEIEHTASDLQTLRPNQGVEHKTAATEGTMFIKNGMNPAKLFTQVHYLKGYFLLRWLGDMIGSARMKATLREYIERHHGEMVRSQDFLSLMVDKHPEFSQQGYTIQNICDIWLDCPGLPQPLKSYIVPPENSLYRTTITEADKWDKLDKHHKRMRSAAKRPKSLARDHFRDLSTEQLMLVLDSLLQKRSVCSTTLARIRTQYKPSTLNADIQHKWCELVVKHLYSPGFKDVGTFLREHQAMGVYLYGEMVISRCLQLRTLAEQCFNDVREDMEKSVRNIVHTMLYGSPQDT